MGGFVFLIRTRKNGRFLLTNSNSFDDVSSNMQWCRGSTRFDFFVFLHVSYRLMISLSWTLVEQWRPLMKRLHLLVGWTWPVIVQVSQIKKKGLWFKVTLCEWKPGKLLSSATSGSICSIWYFPNLSKTMKRSWICVLRHDKGEGCAEELLQNSTKKEFFLLD